MQGITNQSLIKNCSFINGQWMESDDSFELINPANNELLVNINEVTEGQLELAVQSAKSALPAWQALSAHQRAKLMLAWEQKIADNINDLALLMTREQGKPLADAKGEILYGNTFINWFAEEGKRVYGDMIPAPTSDKRIMVTKQAVGVVGAITPWNFPSAMITRKAAAALAAGCSFIVKPAAETPLSALALATLAQEAGIPDGVINVVVGTDAPKIGSVLTTHPDISKFTFTGSTRTGKILTQQCASSVKKVSMELGGNAPFIVFDDADLEAAASALVAAKFRNAGQVCICPNRVYVSNSVMDKFAALVEEKVATLKQGNGEEPGMHLGCLIHQQAADNVHNMVEQAIRDGAKLVKGGLSQKPSTAFYPPTILANVEHGSEISKNEIFGPVITLLGFDAESEAIEKANDTEYGLACYFFSEGLKRCIRVAEQLDYGMVGVNETAISNTVAPFGGVKQSGYGREGSKYGLDDYLEIKYTCFGGF